MRRVQSTEWKNVKGVIEAESHLGRYAKKEEEEESNVITAD